MVRQNIEGLRSKTISAEISKGDLANIKSILAGEVEELKEIAKGGVALQAVPNPLNKQSFQLIKREANGTKHSAMVSIPHIKLSVGFIELSNDFIGKFDAGYGVGSPKCVEVVKKFDNF